MKKLLALALLITGQLHAQCWKTVSNGGGHTMALKTDNTLWTWGLNNYYSALGNGNTESSNVPIQVNSATDWLKISAGYEHCIALKADGSLWGWGNNNWSQMGNNDLVIATTPIQVGNATDWKEVSAESSFHTLAIKNNGTLWAWGSNFYGECGTASTINTNVGVPTQLTVSTAWSSISTGYFSSFAIKSTGTLWAWGRNEFGQLGNGNTNNVTTVTQIGTATNWKIVKAGRWHTLAIKTNGTLWAWGSNDGGQLGDGTFIDKHIPIQIGTSTDWKTIAAGYKNSLAIKNDGTLWSWGANEYGQVGNGTNTSQNVPLQIGTATDWETISQNGYVMAIKTNGEIWGWGDNYYGDLGNGANENLNVPTLIGCNALTTEPIAESRFSIYPNPTKDHLFFHATPQRQVRKFRIVDLTGKVLIEQKNISDSIDVRGLQQGIYIVQAFSDATAFQQKFIKE